MRKKILFVINPFSGIGRQKKLEALISKHLRSDFDAVVRYTERPGHAADVSRDAVGIFDAVAAVGGDGTVNEVSRSLIGTNTALAIIPTGSGNGLARHLKIPTNIVRALEVINRFHRLSADTITINDRVCANVAGIGFDAHIGHLFADHGRRGLLSYIRLISREFPGYVPETYRVMIDGCEYVETAFLITFANSSQWGNNARIAPKADIRDGQIEVCILKEFPSIAALPFVLRLFSETMDGFPYLKTIRGRQITVIHDKPLRAHIDGEPVCFGKIMNISANPLSLNILVPG